MKKSPSFRAHAHRTFSLRPIAVAALALTACWALPAAAKGTLVYCSEGSPEGFQPQFFSTGTTFDAVSVPMFNRLVEFELGTTNIVPALAESWTISPDGKMYTFSAFSRHFGYLRAKQRKTSPHALR